MLAEAVALAFKGVTEPGRLLFELLQALLLLFDLQAQRSALPGQLADATLGGAQLSLQGGAILLRLGQPLVDGSDAFAQVFQLLGGDVGVRRRGHR